MMDLRIIARALGGEVVSGQVLAPAPGHSSQDRSLSVRLSPRAPGGLLVHLFSGGDPLAAKDHVLDVLRWPRKMSNRADALTERAQRNNPSDSDRTARALAIWHEGRDPRGTPVEAYLTRYRGLILPEEAAGAAVRYHPACPFAGAKRVPAMVCLVRDVRTDAPRAIHRTVLELDGRKATIGGNSRLSLGPISGGAIKLTPDSGITGCLGVGEGLESALSLQRLPEFGRSPVWSLLSAGGVERLPVLPGIESLWLAVDHDEAGVRASHACAQRWREAGSEIFLVRPLLQRTDLNDVFKEHANA